MKQFLGPNPRRAITLFVVVAAILLVGLTYGFYVLGQPDVKESHQTTSASPDYAAVKAVIGQRNYMLEVADTPAKRELGLGKRASLEGGSGMLFVYSEPGNLCFWMKDMHFAIDMIWLDADKKVIKVESDVQPETYPDTYCPETPAQYVVELDSGQAAAAGLKPGDSISFNL